MERFHGVYEFVKDVGFGLKVRTSSVVALSLVVLAPILFIAGSYSVPDDFVVWAAYMFIGTITVVVVEVFCFALIVSNRHMKVLEVYNDRMAWSRVVMRKNWSRFDSYRKDFVHGGPFLAFDYREDADNPIPVDVEFWGQTMSPTSHWLHERVNDIWEVRILFSDLSQGSLTIPLMAFGLSMGILLVGGFIILSEAGYIG